MSDDTHDVGLAALFVNGVAHRLAVDGEAVVGLGLGRIPPLQGAVQRLGVDADEAIANDGLARHEQVPVFAAAAEPLAGLGAEAVGPVGDRLVTAHAAQDCPGGDGQHRRQGMPPPLGAARVGDVGEEVGQHSHVVGGQHDPRVSGTVAGFQQGIGQYGSGIGLQGPDKHLLGREGGCAAVALAGSAKAACVAQIGPIRRLVDGALVAFGVDESLQQHQGMAEAPPPVGGEPPFAQGKCARAEVWVMPVGQDQKAAVVGDQVQAVALVAVAPANPAIPHGAFPCRRRKAEQSHPLAEVGRHVPKGFADLGERA